MAEPKKKKLKGRAEAPPAMAAAPSAATSVSSLFSGLASSASASSSSASGGSGAGSGGLLTDTFSRLFAGSSSASASGASPPAAAASKPAASSSSSSPSARGGRDGGSGGGGSSGSGGGAEAKSLRRQAPGAAASGAASGGGGGAAAAAAAAVARALKRRAPVAKVPVASAADGAAPGTTAGGAAKGRRTEEEDKERQARTLFIGNVPLDWDKKKLRTTLREAAGEKYTGKFDPIWFRAEPLKQKWTQGKLRKAGSILKEYDEKAADAKHAYVVLEEASAVLAMRHVIHGFTADERHVLRADGVGESARLEKFDRKRSVFVGNLASNIGEADLRKVFSSAGNINAVRIVRDKVTKKCKGIAFVLFEKRVSVKAALKLWGAEISGREIRVTKVEKQDGGAGEKRDPESHPAERRIELKWRRRKSSKPRRGPDAGAAGGKKKKRLKGAAGAGGVKKKSKLKMKKGASKGEPKKRQGGKVPKKAKKGAAGGKKRRG